MGQVKNKMMEEEEEFWNECTDMIKSSEDIQEFWGQYSAAEKDGSISRPENISMTELEEAIAESWNEVWTDYLTPLS